MENTVLIPENQYKANWKNLADGLNLLADINDKSIATVFLTRSIAVCWINWNTEMKAKQEEKQDVS